MTDNDRQAEVQADLNKLWPGRYQVLGLMATGPHDGSICHRLHGRHYHCAECGDVTGSQGHMRGNPPAFSCALPRQEGETTP